MPAAPAYRTMTPEEYLAFERAAEVRHELHNGVLVSMAGGSLAHGFLIGNMTRLLGSALAPRGCMVGSSDIKVRVPSAPSFYYPDVVVVCETPQTADEQSDVLLNPTAIVEVLSPSTEGYDRGAKAEAYRTIPSLRTLLFVAQDRVSVQWNERHGDFWMLHETTGRDGQVALEHLQVTISLAELYANIELPPVQALPGQS